MNELFDSTVHETKFIVSFTSVEEEEENKQYPNCRASERENVGNDKNTFTRKMASLEHEQQTPDERNGNERTNCGVCSDAL